MFLNHTMAAELMPLLVAIVMLGVSHWVIAAKI